MAKRYIIALNDEERQTLETFIRTGRHGARQINHARILLKADINQPHGGYRDTQIQEALDVSVRTIERVRKRFVEEGLDSSINHRPGAGRKRTITGEDEAHLIALRCRKPPLGHARWTLRLLADQIVELGYIEQISHETVRQTLKKRNSNPGGKNAG